MKYFASLKTKDVLSLTGLIILGYTWILVDQLFFKQSGQRFIAFSIVLVLLFYILYQINKPQNVWYYANTIALILVIFVILLSIITHVIMEHDFAAKSGHLALLWVITGAMPYVGGLIYLALKKK